MRKRTATATTAPSRLPTGKPAPGKATPGKPTTARARAPEEQPALGPGLHGGIIDLATDQTYRVRMLDGTRRVASLADGVERALADECLRAARMVVLADGPRGPVILGALQTSRGITLEPDGTAVLRARAVRVQAERSFLVEAGETSIRLDGSGAVRARGDRMVVDMGSNVRFVSALVELP